MPHKEDRPSWRPRAPDTIAALAPLATAVITAMTIVLGGISKVDDMLAQQQKMYDRIYAPAESLARIEERLNSIDQKLERDEKELLQQRKSE